MDNPLESAIAASRTRFADLLARHVGDDGMTREQYVRYLSMQYHLTKGVHRYFMTAASHPDLSRRRRLRKFLFDFGNEEELHYLIAANDLAKMGETLLPVGIDVRLWHAFFETTVRSRPFLRIGTACILENISGGQAKAQVKRALSSSFIQKENSKFLVLHQHETLPHGDQLIEAMQAGDLTDEHVSDLVHGAAMGTVLYLRMAEWALDPRCLGAIADEPTQSLSDRERADIGSFEMSWLD